MQELAYDAEVFNYNVTAVIISDITIFNFTLDKANPGRSSEKVPQMHNPRR